VLTAITVFVAVAIGTIQLLSLISHFTDPDKKFAQDVEKIGEHYDVIGGAICGAFVLFGVVSVFMYKPWRRWIEKRRGRRWQGGRYFDNERAGGDVELIDLDNKPGEIGVAKGDSAVATRHM
jgi:high-affinity nickel-transport protein